MSVIARLGYDNNNNNNRIEAGYNKIRIPQAVLVPLLVKKICYVCRANAVLDFEHESSYILKPMII